MKAVLRFAMMLTICGAIATTVAGQTPSQKTDGQVRILVHKQVAKPGLALVGWAIASDVTNPLGQRGLVVAGLGYKWKSTWGVNWVEVMPGSFVIEGQKPDPVLDLRSSCALPEGLVLGVEGLRAFRTDRTILISTLTAPVPGTKGRLRAGLESDLIWKAGPDSLGAGPRVALKLGKNLSWALGYQFRAGAEADFLRSYVLFSF